MSNEERNQTELSYGQLMDGLKQGPRMKGHATLYFEKILHAFLDPTIQVECRYNMLGELEVKVQSETEDDETYNLTKILEHHPDFEQISFDNEAIKRYEDFIVNEATNKPFIKAENQITFPTPEEYAIREDESNLHYGEKLATTIYTTEFYSDMNTFLRRFGRTNKTTNDTEQLNLYIKEVMLASAFTSHGLSKPKTLEDNAEQPQLTVQAILDQDKESLQAYGGSTTETLYRGEKVTNPSDLERLKQKTDTIENNTPVVHASLTSTTTNQRIAETAFATGGTKIISEIKQPQALNPIGKDVSNLSQFQGEGEVLFPPDTQFLYYKYDHEHENEHKVYAIPVRTIEGIDPFSYSHSEMKVRTDLIHAREELNESKYEQDDATKELANKLMAILDQAIADFDSQKPRAEKIAQLYTVRKTWAESAKDEAVKKSFNAFSRKLNHTFVNAFFDQDFGLAQASNPQQLRMVARISINQLSNNKNLKSNDIDKLINSIATNKEVYKTAIQTFSKKDNKNKTNFHKIIDKSPVHTLKLVDLFLQNANNLPLVLQALAEKGYRNKTGWIRLGAKLTQADKQVVADLISSTVKKLDVQDAKNLMQEIKVAEYNKASPYHGLYEKWNILGLINITGKTKLLKQLVNALEDHCKPEEKATLLDNHVLTNAHAEDNASSYNGLNHTGLFHLTTSKWQKAAPQNQNKDDDSDRERPHHFEEH